MTAIIKLDSQTNEYLQIKSINTISIQNAYIQNWYGYTDILRLNCRDALPNCLDCKNLANMILKSYDYRVGTISNLYLTIMDDVRTDLP